MTTEPSFLAIVVPVLNEEQYIRPCLESLLAQAGVDACEILVLDGGSVDSTAEVVAEMAASHSCIRLVPNPRRTQAAAVNLAARIAAPQATVLIRADAHALYPSDFVRNCLRAMEATAACSVVTPMRAVGQHGFQRAVAAAQNGRLGNGGSLHRTGGPSGFVEHGHHAAFDRRLFLERGGYDESFTHNEDAEYDHRARLAGGRIWMCGEAVVIYFPRRDIAALARQYFSHGCGRAGTVLKHRMRPQLRQLAPVCVLAGTAGGLAGLPLNPWLGAAPAAYLLFCLAWGAAAAARKRDAWLLAMGPAAIVMHLSWAAGFVRTCLKGPRSRAERRDITPAVASPRSG